MHYDCMLIVVFFFKQKTAYEMRISDWSSDVCSSDLALRLAALELHLRQAPALPFIADDLFINYDDARSEAGLRALADLSEHTQVIFLSHHPHLVELARRVFGESLNVVALG